MPIETFGEGVSIHEALVPTARQRYNVRVGENIVCFCYDLKEARAEAKKIAARIKESGGVKP